MRIALLVVNVLILAACQPLSEAPSSSSPAAVETSSGETALLLTEEAAASILRDFLIDCIESWKVEHESRLGYYTFKRGGPVPEGAELEWWNNFARQPLTARHAGTTLTTDIDRRTGTQVETYLETWSVTGPGLKRTEDGYSPVTGIWGVYAGRRIADPLDGPARLALAEFKRPLDSNYDPNCSGYQKN